MSGNGTARPLFAFRHRHLHALLLVISFGAAVLLLLATPRTAEGAPFTVTNALDSGAGSLRQAMLDALANAEADTITFDASLDGQTITLQSTLPTVNNMDGLTIDSSGVGITISGGGAHRAFVVDGGSLTIDSLTITNANETFGDGGAISAVNSSAVTLLSSYLHGNSAAQSGGAISILSSSQLTMRNSTLSGNTAADSGGALLINSGTAVIENSTISGNHATTTGGGAALRASITLTNVTISGNTAGAAYGGVHHIGQPWNIQNTLIAGNTAPANPNCGGSPTSLGNNLIGDTAGCTITPAAGDQFDVAANLDVLADNGGGLPTHALLAGSPAIDSGDSAACQALAGGAVDQRGVARPVGACDIGAYEAIQVSVADLAASEGNALATVNAVVTLSSALPAGFADIAVDYATADGTGTAGTDYVAVPGTTLTFTAGGATSANAPVDVIGNTMEEGDRTFLVNLSNVSAGALLGDAQATVTIEDNDGPIEVTNTNDFGPGSLRQAMLDAFADPGADTINVTVSGTVTLASSLPTVNDADGLVIDASGADFTINGADAHVAFLVDGGVLEVRSLTITETWRNTFGGPALWVRGGGSATVVDSYFHDNQAIATTHGGGAVVANENSILTVRGSTIADNFTRGNAGAIHVVSATATIENTTISGNDAEGWGGGVISSTGSTVTMTNVTISGNHSDNVGGGLFQSGGAALNLRNTIVSGNTAPASPDCGGSVTSLGNNLVGDTTACTIAAAAGDQLDQAANLGALADNGGGMPTHGLLAGSAAIDNGDTCAGTTDQRGIGRTQGPACDIGAYEALQLSIADATAAEGDAGTTAFNAVVSLSSALPAGFPSVTVDFSTADGTGTAGVDYVAVAGTTLTFTAGGASTANASVDVNGNTVEETNRTFLVDLANASGAVLVDAQATLTIQDDDAPPPPPPPPPADSPDEIGGVPVDTADSVPVDETPVEGSITGPDGTEITVAFDPTTLPPGLPESLTLAFGAVGDLDALRTAPDGATLLTALATELTGEEGGVPATLSAPAEVTLTLAPDGLGGADPATVFVFRSTPAGWVRVPAEVTVSPDGTLTYTAAVEDLPATLALMSVPDWGAFVPAPPAAGVGLTRWQGGDYEEMDSALPQGAATWVLVDGEWVVYRPGAPAFVLAAFLEAFPDGLPPGTPVLITR